jgi:uncharacterized protein (TIGR00369 family)
MQLKFTIPEMQDYLAGIFPQLAGRFQIEEMRPLFVMVRMTATEADLRPGGTVSGPAMFALADCAFYIALLAMIGREALAVTTSCAIDFLRKPAPGGLTAEARILKLGSVLAVGDVLIFSDGVKGPVARAGLTYSIPPGRGAA